jgi:hypothetical protein
VSAASDPVADTPLVIEVRCTGAVFGFGGAVVVAHATTPLATRAIATLPRAALRAAGLCQKPENRLSDRCFCAACLDIRTLLPPASAR